MPDGNTSEAVTSVEIEQFKSKPSGHKDHASFCIRQKARPSLWAWVATTFVYMLPFLRRFCVVDLFFFFLLHRRTRTQVLGPDHQIAALAVLIKNSGIARSFADWQRVLMDDPLFTLAGGRFNVPSINTLKQWLRRDFISHLQDAFDEHFSGFNARSVVECVNPATHSAKYQIRGEWSAIRKQQRDGELR